MQSQLIESILCSFIVILFANCHQNSGQNTSPINNSHTVADETFYSKDSNLSVTLNFREIYQAYYMYIRFENNIDSINFYTNFSDLLQQVEHVVSPTQIKEVVFDLPIPPKYNLFDGLLQRQAFISELKAIEESNTHFIPSQTIESNLCHVQVIQECNACMKNYGLQPTHYYAEKFHFKKEEGKFLVYGSSFSILFE